MVIIMAILITDDKYKSYNCKQKKESVYEEFDHNGKRIIVVTGFSGDNSIDRDKEIIDQTKWRPESYNSRIVKFMPFHEYNKVPVGLHRWIKAFPDRKNATATKFQAQFGPHEFGLAFGELYLDGIMDSFSEGFEAFKWITPNEKSVDWVRTYIDQERYEISVVTIPANKNAVVDDIEKAFDEVSQNKDETKAVIKQYLTFEMGDNGIIVEKTDSYTIKNIELESRITLLEQEIEKLKTNQEHDASEYTGEIEIDLDSIEVEVDALDAEGDTLEVLVGVGDVQVDIEAEIQVEI
jgi:hypothetical protein